MPRTNKRPRSKRRPLLPTEEQNVDLPVDIKEEPDDKSSADSCKLRRLHVKSEYKAQVDSECPEYLQVNYHVFEGPVIDGDENHSADHSLVWSVMLNQTNIANNNNKYYMIQLLRRLGSSAVITKPESGLECEDTYLVWRRWGRVGYRGQTTVVHFQSNLAAAQGHFCAKFAAKTGNVWSVTTEQEFTRMAGKYIMVSLDHSVGDVAKVERPTEMPESQLDKRVQDLVSTVCDFALMRSAVVEMKYDVTKAPLGKLTGDQIKSGYEALCRIATLINNPARWNGREEGTLSALSGQDRYELTDACNNFYSIVPHASGYSPPPVIRDRDQIKEKMELLSLLADIEVAMSLVLGGSHGDGTTGADTLYERLNCGIHALDRTSAEFQCISECVLSTHGPTHGGYKMDIMDILKLEKGVIKEEFQNDKRILLFHGSRMSNMAGILVQGLRIAPPEAPSTGYMFGKGVYFADVSSKSANYCQPSLTNAEGILLLCEVAVGDSLEMTQADPDAATKVLDAGMGSVKGIGRYKPRLETTLERLKLEQTGCLLPMGPVQSESIVLKELRGGSALRRSRRNISTSTTDTALDYNEYVVYDVGRITLKYAIRLSFVF